MFWYIVICILMLYPTILVWIGQKTGKNTDKFALKTACLILCFFMAARAVSVGVDTKYFCYVFSQFREIPLSKVFHAVTYATADHTWTFDFEPGYRLVNKLLSMISGEPQVITIFNSIAIFVLLYFLIKKESPNYLLSIWLYITLGVFQTEMNVARNAIAIFMCYNAFPYIKKGEFWKYAAVVVIASTIHKTAIVFLPLYWLIRKGKWNIKSMILNFGIFAFIGLNFSVISPYLVNILPSGLERYFSANTEKFETIIVGVFYAFLLLFVRYFMTVEERRSSLQTFQMGTWMFALNICFFCLNIGLGSAARMAALFGPYMIIYIPQLLSEITQKSRRDLATAIVVGVCGCQYIMRLMINNIGGSMPYRFFWQ